SMNSVYDTGSSGWEPSESALTTVRPTTATSTQTSHDGKLLSPFPPGRPLPAGPDAGVWFCSGMQNSLEAPRDAPCGVAAVAERRLASAAPARRPGGASARCAPPGGTVPGREQE